MSNEIKVGFTLTSFVCSPEQITEKVGLVPTKTWVAGGKILGGARDHKENGWRLELVGVGVNELESLLGRLLEKLESSSGVISKLASKHYAEISCVVYATEYVPELHFSHETLGRIVRLGAGIDIDLYCLMGED